MIVVTLMIMVYGGNTCSNLIVVLLATYSVVLVITTCVGFLEDKKKV